jgi:hypothetical protein
MFQYIMLSIVSLMVIGTLLLMFFTSGDYAKKLDMKLHKKHGK